MYEYTLAVSTHLQHVGHAGGIKLAPYFNCLMLFNVVGYLSSYVSIYIRVVKLRRPLVYQASDIETFLVAILDLHITLNGI